jgi:branched-chain amino acid transport system substrate-binding protein
MPFRTKASLILAAACWPLLAGSAQADIRIAVTGPVTGPLAAPGEEIVNGAKQAAADINAKGGINGEKVEISIFDDACDPKQAVSVANSIVSQGFDAVAGHFCSGSTLPASDVYAESGIPEMTVSSNPKITERGYQQIFRISGRDDRQGPIGAAFIAKTFPSAKVALVSDKSEYGQGLVGAVRDALSKDGISVTLDDAINPGEKDYSALIAKLKAQGVEVLYYGGYHTEAGLIMRQASDTGLDLKIIGADSLNTAELAAIVGATASNIYFTFPRDATKTEKGKALAEEFGQHNMNPGGWTLYSYAIIQAFADAAAQAGGKTDQIATILHTQPVETVLGKITFDEKGDNTDPGYSLYHFENGLPVEMAKP